MSEWGVKSGLAQVLDWDRRAQQDRYNNEQAKQANIAAQQKAKMFADDWTFNNAMNSHDNPLVKQFAQQQLQKIGQYLRQNPDWEVNPIKRATYNQMIHELKDNPDLNRGLRSDANYAQFTKDLAEKSKNPELYDAEAYNGIMQQWNNYLKYGNQLGEEAAKKQGKKEFTYTQPQDFVDLTKDGLEYGNKFNDFEVKPLPGGGLGSYQQVPKESSLNASVTDYYALRKRQIDKEAARYGYNPMDYAKKLYTAGIKTKTDYGDYSSLLGFKKFNEEKSMAKPEGVWTKDIVNVDKSTVNGGLLKEALGATPPLKIKGDNGAILDLTGKEIDYTGRNTYLGDDKKKGIKHFEVSTNLTSDEAQKAGVLIHNIIGDNQIDPKWRRNARIKTIKNAKGEDVEVVEMYDFVPFEINNATYQGVYDQKATTAKFQESPNEEYQSEEPIVSGSGNYLWNGKEWVPRK